ncbi:unnamed protein product [Arabidopsis halleri]
MAEKLVKLIDKNVRNWMSTITRGGDRGHTRLVCIETTSMMKSQCSFSKQVCIHLYKRYFFFEYNLTLDSKKKIFELFVIEFFFLFSK